MGLAICRKIVERHWGTITARSTPDQGTTFIINLPLKQEKGAEQNRGAENRPPDGHGRTVSSRTQRTASNRFTAS